MALPTGRPAPSAGLIWASKPGLALTSMTAPRAGSWVCAHVFQHHVHTGNVQADDPRGQGGGGRDAGVHEVGDIKGHIAIALNQHPLVFGRDGLWASGRHAPVPESLRRRSLGITTLSGNSSPRRGAGSVLICSSANWSMGDTPSPVTQRLRPARPPPPVCPPPASGARCRE
jgi:hypothetical protein